jgi:hypothetical protein
MRARLGASKAITATAHKLARLVYAHGRKDALGGVYLHGEYVGRAALSLVPLALMHTDGIVQRHGRWDFPSADAYQGDIITRISGNIDPRFCCLVPGSGLPLDHSHEPSHQPTALLVERRVLMKAATLTTPRTGRGNASWMAVGVALGKARLHLLIAVHPGRVPGTLLLLEPWWTPIPGERPVGGSDFRGLRGHNRSCRGIPWAKWGGGSGCRPLWRGGRRSR